MPTQYLLFRRACEKLSKNMASQSCLRSGILSWVQGMGSMQRNVQHASWLGRVCRVWATLDIDWDFEIFEIEHE